MRKNLIILRQQKGYSQTDIAKMLDISLRQYQRIESGESEGKLKLWKQLSSILNESINYLID